MTRFSVVLAIVVVTAVAACGYGAATATSGDLTGTVKVGPTCPVGCSDKPVPNITLHFLGPDGSSAEFAKAITDDQGHYEVALPSGNYEVRLSGTNPMSGRIGTLGASGPSSVTIRAGQNTRADYLLFSGIL